MISTKYRILLFEQINIRIYLFKQQNTIFRRNHFIELFFTVFLLWANNLVYSIIPKIFLVYSNIYE